MQIEQSEDCGEQELQSMSQLRFYQQEELYQYKLNTRIDFPHSTLLYGVASFYCASEDMVKFVTFGDDNKMKIWQRYLRQKNTSLSTKEEHQA